MKQNLHIVAILGTLIAQSQPALVAQRSRSRSEIVPIHVDSNWRNNSTTASATVFQFDVVPPVDATWIQLRFGRVWLTHGSRIRVTCLANMYSQVLDGAALQDYHGFTAFFLAGPISVELVAGPRAIGNRIEIHGYSYRPGSLPMTDSLCSSNDFRQPSNYTWACRLAHAIEGGPYCSGYLTRSNPGSVPDRDFVYTAAHCSPGDPPHAPTWGASTTAGLMFEFNVPASLSNGTPQPSHPDDQYPIRTTTSSTYGWRLCGSCYDDSNPLTVSPNSNTALLPRVRQGSAYLWTSFISSGMSIKVAGYGVTEPVASALNQTQKSHSGSMVHESCSCPGQPRTSFLVYDCQTTGADSGAPVIIASTGWVVGTHVRGACNGSEVVNEGVYHGPTKSGLNVPGTVAPGSSVGGQGSGPGSLQGVGGSVGGEAASVMAGMPQSSTDSPLPVFLVYGLSNTLWASTGASLPYNLSSFGMPSSTLYVSVDAVHYIVTDQSGSARHVIPIPFSSPLTGLRLYAQAIYQNPASVEEWSVTRYVNFRIGGAPGNY
jgi:hypothetical protein